MDLRVLRYFLTVTRERSISRASEVLHVTQPTLSRQLHDLEKEFGAQLFTRGSKTQGITLTEKGFLLRKRAEEILELADRTHDEMLTDNAVIGGDIMIGGAESDSMRIIARVAAKLQKKYPDIHYHLYSGNAEEVKERLDKGLLDFGIFVDPTDLSRYETFQLPTVDHWGVLVREDSSFAEKEYLTIDDLLTMPLIVSRQRRIDKSFEDWCGISTTKLNIVATYNLIYNARLLAEEGYGNVLCLDKLVDIHEYSTLRFIPTYPVVDTHMHIAWKKYQVFSKAAQVFLDELQEK